jgi:hypothetical protein
VTARTPSRADLPAAFDRTNQRPAALLPAFTDVLGEVAGDLAAVDVELGETPC